MCGPRRLDYTTNILYHNLGNGHFEDVSKSSGFQKTTGHYYLSVAALDYDNDGWPDISSPATPALHPLPQQPQPHLHDTATQVNLVFDENGRQRAGMGSTAADYDGDGRLDLFKTNFSDDTSTLYHANADGAYADVTFPAGLGINPDALGWGAIFADVDNDGCPTSSSPTDTSIPKSTAPVWALPSANAASSTTTSATENSATCPRLRPRPADTYVRPRARHRRPLERRPAGRCIK